MTTSGPSPVSDSPLRRRSLLLGGLGGVGGALALATLGNAAAAAAADPPPPFDFDTGNFIDFFSPTDANAGVSVSTSLFAPMDVTIFIWINHLTVLAWFDAVAPYHPTAVGVHTRVPRRPASESATNRNLNTALIHASYQVVKAVVPEQTAVIRQMMTTLGLNPDDESVNPTTAVGIGNRAGKGVIAARLRDGMNLLGDEGRRYHPKPFADYTGYQPVNTAFELVDPTRWQPALTPHHRRLGPGPGDKGVYTVQHFVTPQMARVEPNAFRDPSRFRLAPPDHTSNPRSKNYKKAVDEILAASANLTDEQKVNAEFFDNKLLGIGQALAVVGRNNDRQGQLGIHGWAHMFFVDSTAVFDALIVVWHHKIRYDAVRPFSAVHHVYGRRPVRAWGGPGLGTVNDMPANEWTSYLKVADHPEYPSGSTTLCSASAQSLRRFFGSDALGWRFPIPAGWTLVEPGITPAAPMSLYWPTWTAYVRDCGMSRVWGGVHFKKTVERSIEFGAQIGDRAYEYVRRYIDGDVRN